MAILAACENLRDRFLLSLLAETGMRAGQALGLRHADFVSRKREVHIVPRAGNANGARAKIRSATVIPVSTPLVRLHSEHMHTEYGDIDSDYVFVNLFAGTIGAAMTYPAVHQLIGRIAARTGISFTAHAPPQPRHRHGPPGRAGRGGRAAAHPPLPSDHEPDLCPSRRSRHPGGTVQGRSMAEGGGDPVNYPVPAAQGTPRLPVVSGEAAALDGEWASDRSMPGAWASPPGGDAAMPASTGSASPGSATTGQALVPVPPGDRVRVHHHRRRGTGAHPVLPVPCHLPPGGRRAGRDHPVGPGGLPVLAAHRGILGRHPGAVPVDDPGVLRDLPPLRLAPRTCRRRHHLR